MKRAVKACVWLIWTLALARACHAGNDLPEPEGVLRKVLAHAQASAASEAQSYLYTKQTVTQDIDAAGRPTSRKVQVKTSQSRPIGPADASKWSNSHGVNLDEELLDRYSLKVAGRVALRGRRSLEITFSPKDPPMPVHRPLDRLLNRATGTIWVDEEDYELAGADLRLTEPVRSPHPWSYRRLEFPLRTHPLGRRQLADHPDGNHLPRPPDSQSRPIPEGH